MRAVLLIATDERGGVMTSFPVYMYFYILLVVLLRGHRVLYACMHDTLLALPISVQGRAAPVHQKFLKSEMHVQIRLLSVPKKVERSQHTSVVMIMAA